MVLIPQLTWASRTETIVLSVFLCPFSRPMSRLTRVLGIFSRFFVVKRWRTIVPHTVTSIDSRHTDRRPARALTFGCLALWLQHWGSLLHATIVFRVHPMSSKVLTMVEELYTPPTP